MINFNKTTEADIGLISTQLSDYEMTMQNWDQLIITNEFLDKLTNLSLGVFEKMEAQMQGYLLSAPNEFTQNRRLTAIGSMWGRIRGVRKSFEQKIPTVVHSILWTSNIENLEKTKEVIQKNFAEGYKSELKKELSNVIDMIDQRCKKLQQSKPMELSKRRIYPTTSESTNLSYLPQEIISVIFDFIGDDFMTISYLQLVCKKFSQPAKMTFSTEMRKTIDVIMPYFKQVFFRGTYNPAGIYGHITFNLKGQIIGLSGADNHKFIRFENKKEFVQIEQVQSLPQNAFLKEFNMIYKWDIKENPTGPFKEWKPIAPTNAQEKFQKMMIEQTMSHLNDKAIQSHKKLIEKFKQANMSAPNFYDLSTHMESVRTLWLAFLLNQDIPIDNSGHIYCVPIKN